MRWHRRDFIRSAAASACALFPPSLLAFDKSAQTSNKKIAAIVTSYFRYSHADDIVTRFMEGFSVVGKSYPPPCQVASLYIDQLTDADIGRPLARHYKIPVARTIADALTLGSSKLAVDGVLIIAEHGIYPINARGQILYPRRQFFEQVIKIFRESGRVVPIYNDKHFSYCWSDARWMYDQSRAMGFPMMAGSSVPVAYRHPVLRPRVGIEWENALAVGYNGFEVYGFHALEALQVMTERRSGTNGKGETGVRAVQCLEGPAAWEAARIGQWDRKLLQAAIIRIPRKGLGRIEDEDADAIVYLIEYRDGLRGAAYLSRRHVSDFAFAGLEKGRKEPLSCWFDLPKPQRDHFSFLVQHVASMFVTGKPAYPVERTLLTTGMLAFLVESKSSGHRRIETPELNIPYSI